MRYEVVPFVANITKGQGANEAAEQLQKLIFEKAGDGWRFIRLENIEINVHDPGNKGCFGLGAVAPSQTTTRYDMAVFQRED